MLNGGWGASCVVSFASAHVHTRQDQGQDVEGEQHPLCQPSPAQPSLPTLLGRHKAWKVHGAMLHPPAEGSPAS